MLVLYAESLTRYETITFIRVGEQPLATLRYQEENTVAVLLESGQYIVAEVRDAVV